MKYRLQFPRACAVVGATLLLLMTGCSGDSGSTTNSETSETSKTSETSESSTASSSDAETDPSTSDGTTAGTGMQEPPPDGSCRGDSDCDAELSESCFAPGQTNCGQCQEPFGECVSDTDCDLEGALCQEFSITCPCDVAVDYACQPPCASDEECGGGRTCGDDGRCVFVSCNDGYECAPTHECSPGNGGNDCVRRTCGADVDCGADDQVCVKGRCHTNFGNCSPPAP